MHWKATHPSDAMVWCEIRRDPSVGFYLYHFVNNRCEHDWHYDQIEDAITHALEDYGINRDRWKQIG